MEITINEKDKTYIEMLALLKSKEDVICVKIETINVDGFKQARSSETKRLLQGGRTYREQI